MRMNGSYKNRILISLAAIFFLLISIPSLLLYEKMKSADKEKQILAAYNSMSQIKTTMEMVLTEADRILYQTLFDTALEDYPDVYMDMDYNERHKVNTKMSRITASNIYFSNCIVYYPEDNLIADFDKDLVAESEVYENASFVSAVYQKYTNDTFKEMNIYTVVKDSENVIVLVKPVSVMSYEPRGYLMMQLSPRFVNDILKNLIIEEEEGLFVYDEVGNIVAQKGEFQEISEVERFFSLKTEPESAIIDMNGKEVLAVHIFSKRLAWHIICMIPTGRVFEMSNLMGRFILICTALLSVIAVLLAGLLSSYFYRPITRIKEKLHLEHIQTDEIESIVDNIKNIQADNQNLSALLENNRPALRQFMLQRLLEGESVDLDIADRLQYYGIKFDLKGHFCVGAFNVEPREGVDYSEQQAALLYIYMKENAAAFLLKKQIHVEFLEINTSNLIAVFNYSDMDTKTFREVMGEMYHEVFRNLNQSVTIGVGAVIGGLENIKVSYKTAVKALQNKLFEGSNHIIYYENPHNFERMDLISVYDAIDRIVLSLRQNNRLSISSQIGACFEYICTSTRDSSKVRFSNMYLLTSFLKEMDEMGITCEEMGYSSELYYSDIERFESVEEAKQYFIDFADALVHLINNRQNDKSQEIYEKTKKIIDDSYGDANLNLDVISSQIGFSISYLSKIFKEYEGKSIKPYILDKRMEMAEELLINSRLKVKEIAEQVGYWNDRAFINGFKKYKGITPGEFRDRFKQRN